MAAKKQELSTLNVTLEEWQALQADHSRLSHVASLLEAAESGIEVLSESETAALNQVNLVSSQLRHLLDYDSQLKPIVDLLDSAQIQLQESIYELKRHIASILTWIRKPCRKLSNAYRRSMPRRASFA